jgi:hypothetical protein
MKIEIRLAQIDFSELDGTELDEHGQYGYHDLDCFWVNPAWFPPVASPQQSGCYGPPAALARVPGSTTRGT